MTVQARETSNQKSLGPGESVYFLSRLCSRCSLFLGTQAGYEASDSFFENESA